MDREAALKAIQENVKNENLIKHMLATEAIMRALARRRFDPNSHYISIGNKHNQNLHFVAKISLTQDRNSYSSTI